LIEAFYPNGGLLFFSTAEQIDARYTVNALLAAQVHSYTGTAEPSGV